MDPQANDIDTYIQFAKAKGMEIKYVVDTHVQADHVSGGRTLAQLTGADYCLHQSADVAFEVTPLTDHQELDLGNVSIRVLHTPGHSPGQISLYSEADGLMFGGFIALGFGVGAASSREIDRLNIRVATALAMRRAIAVLLRRTPLPQPHRILIDGLPLPEIGYVHDALIDGDARCQSISAAAILAKTVRDLLMHRLARRYPVYKWETNVGYGTPEHQEALALEGPCRHHRHTFAPLAQLALPL